MGLTNEGSLAANLRELVRSVLVLFFLAPSKRQFLIS